MLVDKMISWGSLLAVAIWGSILVGKILDWEASLEEERREELLQD